MTTLALAPMLIGLIAVGALVAILAIMMILVAPGAVQMISALGAG